MTERERNAVEALKNTMCLVKAFTSPNDAVSASVITEAEAALAAYDTPGNPSMVLWEEFYNSFHKSLRGITGGTVCTNSHAGNILIEKRQYNAIRNALKGGA
jgi:hypothetical protein